MTARDVYLKPDVHVTNNDTQTLLNFKHNDIGF